MRLWLKNLREQNRLSMEEMASRLDVDIAYYYFLESGDTSCRYADGNSDLSVLIASKISQTFDIPISRLIIFEESINRCARHGRI